MQKQMESTQKNTHNFGVVYLPARHIRRGLRICRAVRSGIITGNKIITVHSIRREHKKHKTKQKAPKQSDDYHTDT